MSINLLKHAHWLLQQGLDFLFPPHCAGCQRGGHLLCPTCLQTMQPLTIPFCQHCSIPLSFPGTPCAFCQQRHLELHGLRCVSLYEDSLRSAIHILKYQGQQRLAEPLGLLLAQAFTSYGLRADGIVPLPLHEQRQRERGYNQATLLARICAARLQIPCLENLVIRQRATRAQVGLNAQERQQNVTGAFALASGFQVRALARRSILLIDDVCTTGATLEACAAPLYAAGIAEVWGLVLARPDR
jgi:ComF family protein